MHGVVLFSVLSGNFSFGGNLVMQFFVSIDPDSIIVELMCSRGMTKHFWFKDYFALVYCLQSSVSLIYCVL